MINQYYNINSVVRYIGYRFIKAALDKKIDMKMNSIDYDENNFSGTD